MAVSNEIRSDAGSRADSEFRRAGWFTLLLLLISFVGDGWSGRPSPLRHQLLLLPGTAIFCWALYELLREHPGQFPFAWTPRRALLLAVFFEVCNLGLYFYQVHHFSAVGYRGHPGIALAVFLTFAVLLLAAALTRRISPTGIVLIAIGAYAAALGIAILGFPLTYLRSDMLPVIFWADQNLLHHLSPYTTMYVGDRVYDFPYLPGMIVAYLPFTGMHLDVRSGSIFYVAGLAILTWWATKQDRRLEVAALLALFLLGPFLEYRHELYIQPHWFTLVAVFVLMQRRHFAWAAIVFGISMGIYQFSWILFPFFLLNALRRRGWWEALKLAVLGALGMLAIVGPFLRTALHRIANNTVGQWGLAAHATADPINLSYWVTYFIHPGALLRFQALLMIVIFCWCFLRGGCATLADTLRWMIIALTLFVACNVLVDGYFYLMVLVVMLVYTCVANDWWEAPLESASA